MLISKLLDRILERRFVTTLAFRKRKGRLELSLGACFLREFDRAAKRKASRAGYIAFTFSVSRDRSAITTQERDVIRVPLLALVFCPRKHTFDSQIVFSENGRERGETNNKNQTS